MTLLQSAEGSVFAVEPCLDAQKLAEMARAASALVRSGDSVAISGGDSSYAVAQELRDVRDLTVVTNSVPVGKLLHSTRRRDLTLMFTGGIPTSSEALVGPRAVAAISTLNPDWLFLAVYGMDPRAGLTGEDPAEAETNRALVERARRVVVVANSSKWGVVGPGSIARLDEVHTIVSDDGLGAHARRVLQASTAKLLIVPSMPARQLSMSGP